MSAIRVLLADDHAIVRAGIRKTVEEVPPLPTRQRDLLLSLQAGKDNQTVALEMGLSVKIVENHLTRLYRLLGVQSRLETVNFILRHPQILGLGGQQAAMIPAVSALDKKPRPGRAVPGNRRRVVMNRGDFIYV